MIIFCAEEDVFNLEISSTEDFFAEQQAAVLGDSSGGGPVYILKSFNYGAGMSNWTYTLLPGALPALHTPYYV